MTCYRSNLSTEDFVVHFECVTKEDSITELYFEIGDYYVSIIYEPTDIENNFFLYKIHADSSNSLKEHLKLVCKMSKFYPEIDFDDIESILDKVDVWQTFC